MQVPDKKVQNAIPVALTGGGEMGERIRNLDWSKTTLGPIDQWPKTLQAALSICINSNFPIAIYWGDDLILLYNDAWSPIPGTKHPWALGRPAREVWPDIWPDIEPQFEKAFKGIPGGSKDALLPMQRHGYKEECYFDFTFTPIYGESGKVTGVFNAVIETTYRFINERRSFLLQRLGSAINSISLTTEVIEIASQVLEGGKVDIPFYCIYQGSEADGLVLLRQSEDLSGVENPWPVDELVRGGNARLIAGIDSPPYAIAKSFWPEIPNEAYLSPLSGSDGKLIGAIVLGISPRRKFDKDYEAFCDSVSKIINGELNTIITLDQERKRSEALAEIDRAKTTFFSNISHEFRTPLTLMLSPLENVLETGGNLTSEQRRNIEASFSNTLRLQRLVNTLLDFSRIEAGRLEANFEPVDIGKFTEGLASSFRSAIENAGLEYNVSINSVGTPSHVDVEMWEKIVLNLISNAFKYTKTGKIDVTVKQIDDHIQLSVADTGIGISAEDMSRIFQRFYRVHNSEGRSQEGTGIGLAMVKELINLHRGQITVESTLGKGTNFTVEIPASQTDAKAGQGKNQKRTKPEQRFSFVEEASMWGDGIQHEGSSGMRSTQPLADAGAPKVLVADDNSDMRHYLQRLLQHDFNVQSASNGEDGYRLALEWKPDLILTDIMMPGLDGFGLLKKLKNNLSTRNTPVIFLSARAGEEARVEGIEAGADDYLTKPFSARELIARVTNHIAISNIRRKTEREFYNLFLQSPAHINVMRGPEHVLEFFHPLGIIFTGRDVTGMTIREALPQVEGQGFFELLDMVYNEDKPVSLKEAKAVLTDSQGQPKEHYFNITYLPWKDVQGKIQGVLQFTFEVTETVKERLKAEASERNLRSIAEQAPVAMCVLKGRDHVIQIVNDPVLEIWGRQYDEVINRPVAEAIPEVAAQGLIEVLNDVYNTGKTFFANERPLEFIRHGIPEKVYLNFIYEPLLDPEKQIEGIIAVAVDVTEQVKSRKILERAQSNLRNAIELAELGTWNIDLSTNLGDYSPRVAEWWGLSEAGATFDEMLHCVHPDDREKVRLAVSNATQRAGHFKAEYRVISAISGQERFIQANGKVFYDDDNRPVNLSGIVRDVTLFKMAQQELERQVHSRTAELVQLNNDLSRSNENLRQFAYVASHDLQEPLRKIQTFSDMAKDQLGDEDQVKALLSKIDNSAARMSALIKDVLLYSRITNDEKRLEDVDLNEILENVKTDFELLIHQKRAQIGSPSLPVIKGNKLHIHQVFSNLIGNSLKFSMENPVVQVCYDITSGDGVPDNLDKSHNYYRFEFRDNGIGFDPEYSEQIFGLFSRLHNRRDFGGTGIGLALCRKIVENYGGAIFATSKKGEGASFVFFLPVV
ncbi:MAG: ATP-binding protein [Chryseosolibacter sp.]